jgi:hypothetical protein
LPYNESKKYEKKYNKIIFFLSAIKLLVLNKKVIKNAIANPMVSAYKEKLKSRSSNFWVFYFKRNIAHLILALITRFRISLQRMVR